MNLPLYISPESYDLALMILKLPFMETPRNEQPQFTNALFVGFQNCIFVILIDI